MRNVWKGLVVGGSVGVAAGVVLDALRRGSQKATDAGRDAKDQAAVAADWLTSTAGRGVERLADSPIPDRLREAAHRIAESDPAGQARDVAGHARDAVTQVVAKGKEAAGGK